MSNSLSVIDYEAARMEGETDRFAYNLARRRKATAGARAIGLLEGLLCGPMREDGASSCRIHLGTIATAREIVAEWAAADEMEVAAINYKASA